MLFVVINDLSRNESRILICATNFQLDLAIVHLLSHSLFLLSRYSKANRSDLRLDFLGRRRGGGCLRRSNVLVIQTVFNITKSVSILPLLTAGVGYGGG